MLELVPRSGVSFLYPLVVPRGGVLLDRGTDREREDILGREEGAVLRELDPELGLLLELLDEDEDDELLRLVLAIDTGSASNITPSINNNHNCFSFDSLITKSQINPISSKTHG